MELAYRGSKRALVIGVASILIIGVLAGISQLGFNAQGQDDSYSTGANQPLTIPGMEGLQGFVAGENQITLATYMRSQDQNNMYFEVVGFAISNIYSPQASVYTLKQPMMGVFDQGSNTIQIDMSNIGIAIDQGAVIDKTNIYNTLRYNEQIFIINMDTNFAGTQGYQTIFNVNSISMIAPDGTQNVFTLQQPVQLIFDATTYRMSVPTFPQLTDTWNNYYNDYSAGYYGSVGPVLYPQPLFVSPPVVVPVLVPVPIVIAPEYFPPPFISDQFAPSFFTPNVFCNQFAIAAAAASATAFGGDAFAAASAVSVAVSGGGGAAAAAAAAAAAGGAGGGGIAVAAAAAAAASSGFDVTSATSAIAAAATNDYGASAAAAAATAAASGGADFGGVAAASAAAAAAANNGDPVIATDRIASSLNTDSARTIDQAARDAKNLGGDPKTIASKIGDAAIKSGRERGLSRVSPEPSEGLIGASPGAERLRTGPGGIGATIGPTSASPRAGLVGPSAGFRASLAPTTGPGHVGATTGPAAGLIGASPGAGRLGVSPTAGQGLIGATMGPSAGLHGPRISVSPRAGLVGPSAGFGATLAPTTGPGHAGATIGPSSGLRTGRIGPSPAPTTGFVGASPLAGFRGPSLKPTQTTGAGQHLVSPAAGPRGSTTGRGISTPVAGGLPGQTFTPSLTPHTVSATPLSGHIGASIPATSRGRISASTVPVHASTGPITSRGLPSTSHISNPASQGFSPTHTPATQLTGGGSRISSPSRSGIATPPPATHLSTPTPIKSRPITSSGHVSTPKPHSIQSPVHTQSVPSGGSRSLSTPRTQQTSTGIKPQSSGSSQKAVQPKVPVVQSRAPATRQISSAIKPQSSGSSQKAVQPKAPVVQNRAPATQHAAQSGKPTARR